MTHAFLLLFLLSPPAYAQDVPFYPTQTKTDQDLGAVNRNFSELANRGVDRTDTSKTSTSEEGVSYPTLAGDNAFTGANTFASSTAFNGLVSGTGPVSFSTHSEVSITAIAGTGVGNFSACSATATITVVGSTVSVSAGGGIHADSSANAWVVVLVDGAFALGCSATKGVKSAITGANWVFDLAFSRIITGLSPGQHNFCIGFGSDGGNTFTIQANNTAQFAVREETLR